ncbi:MAG: GGDEF domain-containing protein [Desulfosporosinus sp.]|nr:GGDEF domain-containing protein [Desulfosporosinus sp.]
MSTLSDNWILPLSVLTITGFGFAILSYVIFFRRVQTKTNFVCSAFAIPLIITVYSFVFQKKLPVGHAIALSEIAMMIMLIGLSIILKYKISVESALFANSLAGIALCVVLSYIQFFPFLFQELRTYLIIVFVLTSFFVIVTRKTDEAKLTVGFSFLGISELIALFQSFPAASVAAFALKLYFYLHITKVLFNNTHEEIMKEVVEARRIQRGFDDALRKEIKKHMFFMELSQERMAKISQTDTLTEAYNRKGIMDQMDRLVDNPKIKLFSLLMFDIDKFKTINDTMGHSVGDKCLKTLSKIARGNLRDGDFLGRYGGDEFIILLPNTDTDTAFRVAERFRQKIQETENPHITVSIGIATYPNDGKNNRDLLEYADAGLYISKENGRNRVSRK